MSYDFPAHESTRKRRRWGCTCGCVLLLIILILAGGLVSYLGLRPHGEVQRYALMDGEVDGFGILRANPDDEGVSQFSGFILNRLEASFRANPDDAAKATALDALTKVSSNIVTQFIQGESLIYATYNPATADENILLSAPLKNRFAWGVLRQFFQGTLSLEPSGKEGLSELYPLGSAEEGTTQVMALNPNEVMISDSEPLLRKSLGYARDSSRSAAPGDDLQYFIDQLALDNPPEGEDLAFAMINEESRITNLIFAFEEVIGITGIADRIGSALATEGLTFSDLSGMKLTANLVSADQLDAQITMYSPSAQAATGFAGVFKDALPHITENTSRHGFTVEGTSIARGATTVLTLKVTGIKTWVEQLIPVEESPQVSAAESTPAPTPAATNTRPAIAVDTE